MNAAWQQSTRLTCCNAHSSHTPAPGRPSRVQRYSSSMHRAMEEDSLMIRHDDDDFKKLIFKSICNDIINLTKLRCSNSKLPIYDIIYLSDIQKCTLCNLDALGDEYHYMLIGPNFKKYIAIFESILIYMSKLFKISTANLFFKQ